jgi:exodeoxyribonuclease V
VVTEDGYTVEQGELYRGHYDDHVVFDKGREGRDYFSKRRFIETDWGCTCTATGKDWMH